MSHKQAVEALDQILQDLKDNTKIMGGITLVLASNFRQILPVIPRADQINVCPKKFYLWSYLESESYN